MIWHYTFSKVFHDLLHRMLADNWVDTGSQFCLLTCNCATYWLLMIYFYAATMASLPLVWPVMEELWGKCSHGSMLNFILFDSAIYNSSRNDDLFKNTGLFVTLFSQRTWNALWAQTIMWPSSFKDKHVEVTDTITQRKLLLQRGCCSVAQKTHWCSWLCFINQLCFSTTSIQLFEMLKACLSTPWPRWHCKKYDHKI